MGKKVKIYDYGVDVVIHDEKRKKELGEGYDVREVEIRRCMRVECASMYDAMRVVRNQDKDFFDGAVEVTVERTVMLREVELSE